MQVTFAGCGDAFGSGGRFNTCFHVHSQDTRFLIDCGASSLIALKKFGIDRNAIDTIFITHFHGDHFGGIPYFMLDAQFFSKRRRPLTIAGPEGLSQWYERVMETAFPGSTQTKQKFDLNLLELTPETTTSVQEVNASAARVCHGPPLGPFFSYRFDIHGKSIAYTGDSEWTDSLIPIAQNADLLIAEAYFIDKQVKFHLDVQTLEKNLPRINPKRVILTHMSDDALNRQEELDHEIASDGLVVEV